MMNFGKVAPDETLYIPFASYDSSGASVTLTGLAVTDIEIYKDGSVTQRSSDAGYALLDTDGIDFDAITGIHGVSVDLSDDTDTGFFAVGSQYWVVISSVTIDGQTVSFIAATFWIEEDIKTETDSVQADIASLENPSVAEIVDGVLDELLSSHTTAGTVGKAIQDIETDTGTALSAQLSAIQADTDDIQTRIPAALVAGRMDSNMGAISGSAPAADNMEQTALAVVVVTAAGTPSTTVIDTDLTETTTDHYVGRLITFVTGNLAGQQTDITAYNGTTKEVTVTALTDAPSAGDVFVIT